MLVAFILLWQHLHQLPGLAHLTGRPVHAEMHAPGRQLLDETGDDCQSR